MAPWSAQTVNFLAMVTMHVHICNCVVHEIKEKKKVELKNNESQFLLLWIIWLFSPSFFLLILSVEDKTKPIIKVPWLENLWIHSSIPDYINRKHRQ